MYVLTREEMQALDHATIEEFGLPGEILMEHAGKGCATWLDSETLSPMSAVAVVCGTGNNGGDGYVIARWLAMWGHLPVIYEVGDIAKMSPETAMNRSCCLNLDIKCIPVAADAIPDLYGYDLVVDALFGVGFKGELTDWRALVVEAINDSDAIIAAIDIPSGLDANTGAAETAVVADFTLTMALPKRGLYIGEGRVCAGDVIVIDIGVPPQLAAQFDFAAALVTAPLLPVRDPLGHKTTFGRIGVLAGSPGFSGAAKLATKAALRAGGGLVTLFHPAGMDAAFGSLQPEVMTFALTSDDSAFIAKLETMDVVLAGCGMGTDDFAAHRLEVVIDNHEGPLVLDADALTIISRRRDLLKKLADRPVVLTPHPGEFCRLTTLDMDELMADPMGNLQACCVGTGVNVLLKGATTVFCDGERFLMNIAGNDGLATGGSGDVLAGLVASFIAQGLPLDQAAIGAAHLMGRTAEKLAEQRDTASILPSDIIDNLLQRGE